MVVGEFTRDVDVLVIGGGPAGYSCAFRAAELGRKVVVIDARDGLGGDCLHKACIPTKARLSRREPDPVDAVPRATTRLSRGLAAQASSLGVEIIAGHARFLSSREVQVAGDLVSRFRFKRAVVCVGSAPANRSDLADARTALSPEEFAAAPDRAIGTVAIIGTGPEAIEAATMAAPTADAVHLLLDGQTLLPQVPRSLVDRFRRAFTPNVDERSIGQISHEQGQWQFELDQDTLLADLLVNAGPRNPRNDQLDLAAAGVATDAGGWIAVDARCTTSEPRILAAGDCTIHEDRAGGAIAQGRVAAEVIAGQAAGYEPAAVPTVVWSRPNLAWSGALIDAHEYTIRELIVPWAMSGLAVVMGEDKGCTMIAWDQNTGTVVGAGAVGHGAAELADTFTLAVELGATLQDLADIVTAHPTRSELLAEAARRALNES